MRTDKQRIAKYKAKTKPAVIRKRMAEKLDEMTTAYAAFASEMEAVEKAVRDVLDQEKVLAVRFLYLDFARQVWKCKKRYSGATLDLEAKLTKDRWLGRGLDDRVLRKLSEDVFGIKLN